jgi:uncharacterized membrane protein YhaH (DUF805 family)
MALTNSREVAAFFLARAIIYVAFLFVTPLLLTAVYLSLIRSGGAGLVTVVSSGISVVSWIVTFLLFIAIRGGFGGVPPRVGARPDAVTTSGGEVGAYIIAALIAFAAIYALNVLVLAGVYASLRQSGGPMAILPVSFGVSAAAAVVSFLIFIVVRGAMPAAAAAADESIAAYDDGGGSMGMGQSIATCFRKYAVFSGRASRSEYWYFVLFQVVLYIVLMVVDLFALRASTGVLSTLASLILFLPGLAVLVRRLHDTDRRGWWLLISVIPLVGSIMLLVFLCERGTSGVNRFGIGPASAAIPEVFA